MPRTSAPSSQSPWYSADLLTELQATLAALADIEGRYQSDRAQLRAWAGPAAIKTQFAAHLEDHYHHERDPCVRRLIDLHQHLTRSQHLTVP